MDALVSNSLPSTPTDGDSFPSPGRAGADHPAPPVPGNRPSYEGPRELGWAEVTETLAPPGLETSAERRPGGREEPGAFALPSVARLSPPTGRIPTFTGAGTATVLGVNNAKMYLPGAGGREDDAFGTLASISAALGDLDCPFVRQPGDVDLFYPVDATTRADHPLPLADGSMADDVNQFLRPGVEGLLRQLLADGTTGVVLTFLTLGGGLEGYAGANPGPFLRGTVVPADFSLHTGATLYDELDPSNPAVFPSSTDTAENDYHLGTLDLSERYKRVWIQAFAFAVGTMLRELADDLGTDARTFGGALLGIELFNEIDTCNVIESGGVQQVEAADYWAEAVYRAMLGFWTAFDRNAGAMPRLWWPSLASERVQSSYSDFVLPFHRRVVETVMNRCAEYGNALSTGVLVNQDLHWYRFQADQGTALAVTLIDNVQGVLENYDALGLPRPTVSVCETGATMLQPETLDHADYPAYVTGPDSESARAFQAREVVRRLCTIAASGASFAAWHSLQGQHDDGREFYGTGLLDDDTKVTAPTAHWRPSAFTFKLIEGLWRWLRPYAGEVLLPIRGAGEATWHDVDTRGESDATRAITVLRFRVGAPGTFRYLFVIYFDSSAAESVTAASFTYTTAARRATIWEFRPVPASTSMGGDGAARDELPTDDSATWYAPVETIFRPAAELEPTTMSADDDPLIWLSDRDLSFENA